MSSRGGVRDRYEADMPGRGRSRVSSSDSPPQQDALAESFRDAMGELATGVVMVTCEVGGDPWGTHREHLPFGIARAPSAFRFAWRGYRQCPGDYDRRRFRSECARRVAYRRRTFRVGQGTTEARTRILRGRLGRFGELTYTSRCQRNCPCRLRGRATRRCRRSRSLHRPRTQRDATSARLFAR